MPRVVCLIFGVGWRSSGLCLRSSYRKRILLKEKGRPGRKTYTYAYPQDRAQRISLTLVEENIKNAKKWGAGHLKYLGFSSLHVYDRYFV